MTGDYLLVPDVHTDELSHSLDSLKLQQGYAVKPDASTKIPLDKRADQAIPGVTYISVHFTVAKMQAGASGATKPAANQAPSGGEDTKKTAPSKGTDTKPGGKPGTGKPKKP
jgi:hypothetical protein